MNSILDWLDHDDDDNVRQDGAEDEYYMGLQNPYHCKNGPMDSIEELLLIKGITPELYFGDEANGQLPLSEFLTVHGEWRGALNINSAQDIVVQSVMQGMSQTGTGGTAPHIRAVCTRGAGYLGANALKGQGQGDDWSCTMTDTRTSDAEQPVVLDVTSKANGCYEAEAGSSLGALLITSWQGQTFINPLYAFDGCLGTL